MKNIILITLFVASILCGGCKSLELYAHRTVGSIAIGVDFAVQSFAEYRDSRVGNITVEQDAKVKALYLKYQESAKVAKSIQIAIEKGMMDEVNYSEVVDSVAGVANDLIALINSFNSNLKLKKV